MRGLVRSSRGRRCWAVAAQRRRAATATLPAATSDAPSHNLPQVVLDRAGPRSVAFRRVQQWVVFSDLHVSRKSLATCLEVLRVVHAEAKQRDAGILFLGDWWDRRGDLPVDPLNQIMQEMSGWTQSLLLLPGNHDQVDLNGRLHSLTPLVKFAKTAHVFTEPTVYRNALWLPYRRDERLIRAAMAAAGAVGAVFAHVDVRTAHMNASYQAQDGLDPAIFPRQVPVYTGHYHLPQVVPGTCITYIGSPYQVSRSEQGQQKRLLLLDASWQPLQDIPLDLGRRYFTLQPTTSSSSSSRAVEDPAASSSSADGSIVWELSGILQSSSSSSVGGDVAADGQQGPVLPVGVLQLVTPAGGDIATSSSNGSTTSNNNGSAHSATTTTTNSSSSSPGLLGLQGALHQLVAGGVLRGGDHLKLVVPSTAPGQEVEQLQQAAGQAGIQVEVALQPRAAERRIAAAEQLSMPQLLEQYAAVTAMSKAALDKAHSLLKDLGSLGAAPPPSTQLELTALEVQGYGPFLDPTLYPLSGRGVTVISGRNEDDSSSESNGAGKTSLVSALLWAFKVGDSRGLTIGQVIHEDANKARVAVSGTLNGTTPFWLERTASRSGTSTLRLVLGEEEVTAQEQAITERVLSERFASALLPKTLFFGQEQLMTLIMANDRSFKEDWLAALVDTDCWAAAKNASLAALRGANKQQQVLQGQVALLQEQLVKQQQELDYWQQQEQDWVAQRQQQLEAAQQQQQASVADLAAILQSYHHHQQLLLSWVHKGHHHLQQVAADAEAAAAAASTASSSLPVLQEPAVAVEFDSYAAAQQLRPLQDRVTERQLAHSSAQQQLAVLRSQLQDKQQQYNKQQQQLASHGAAGAATAAAGEVPVCSSCGQTIALDVVQRTFHSLGKEVQQLQQQVQTQQAAVQAAQQDLAAAQGQVEQLQQQQAQQQVEAQQQRDQQLHEQALRHQQLVQEQQALQQQAQALNWDRMQLEQPLQAAAQLAEHTGPAALRQQQQRLASWQLVLDWEGPGGGQQQQQGGPEPHWDRSSGGLLMQQLQRCISQVGSAVDAVLQAAAASQQVAAQTNPATPRRAAAEEQLQNNTAQLEGIQRQQQLVSMELSELKEVDAAFGPQGIPSFVWEGVLAELQAAASTYLSPLAAGMTLELRATKAAPSKGAKAARGKRAQKRGRKKSSEEGAGAEDGAATGAASSAEGEEEEEEEEEEEGPTAAAGRSATPAGVKEEITKIIKVHAANGELRERAVSQLSGGERKRVALALALGYTQLAASRGRLAANLLVLDEVLEKLDAEGCARVAAVLRNLPQSSVLVVGQAHSFVTDTFGAVDVVVKRSGRAQVQLNPAGEAALEGLAPLGPRTPAAVVVPGQDQVPVVAAGVSASSRSAGSRRPKRAVSKAA